MCSTAKIANETIVCTIKLEVRDAQNSRQKDARMNPVSPMLPQSKPSARSHATKVDNPKEAVPLMRLNMSGILLAAVNTTRRKGGKLGNIWLRA